ncbi:phosphodiester glycosidase family protein [Geochorda subterranea]|uniref:Phosphodiester glycosidase family protein n=1 Tax=Geochorda subterranea TaxID=3109564 RepID=A0ABZ1BN96_9FIRM|nr:phosphodiester glycosidase family protein [Limnochorda sp. LNt]WRP14078.1 phosphodiester glycosidase family protein [Limnochorda sp. LNt]
MRLTRVAAFLVVLALVGPTVLSRTPSGLAMSTPVHDSAPSAIPSATDEQVWRAPVAPGIDLVVVRRLDGEGWVDLFALVADLDATGVRADALTGPTLTELAPTSELARRAGAVGAINGDFFHLGTTGAPVGLVVRDGQLWKSPYPGGRPSVAILETPSGPRAWVGRFALEASLTVVAGPDGRRPDGVSLSVSAVNEPALTPGQIGVYDERWGAAPLPLGRWPIAEVAHLVLEAVPGSDSLWVVAGQGPGLPSRGPAPGRMVVLGWRAGAEALRSGLLSPGTILRFTARAVPQHPQEWPAWAEGARLHAAVSGGAVILRGGHPQVEQGQPGDALSRHPRSALGVGRDGRRLVLVAVDGRRSTSRGMDVGELASWLLRLGVTDAVNLDGGGSTSLAARLGPEGPLLVNLPSDGAERAVPVALGLFYDPPAPPEPAPFVLQPVLPQVSRPPWTGGYVLGPQGLVTAAGVASRIATYPPLDADELLWVVDPADLGFFAEPGTFVGLRPGTGRVVALQAPPSASWAYLHRMAAPPSEDPLRALLQDGPSSPAVAASLPVEVVGRPVALRVEPSPLRLVPGLEVPVSVWLIDEEGRRAPADPSSVTLWVQGGAEGTARDGVVSARPLRLAAQPATLEARFFGLSASVPIEWLEQPEPAAAASPSAAIASPAVRPAGPPMAPVPAGSAAPSADATTRVAVLGSLPATEALTWLSEWLAGVEPGLVLAIVRSSAPWEPIDRSAVTLRALGWPVAAAFPEGPGSPPLGPLVSLLGSPNAVATRGSLRTLVVHPSTVSWPWLAGQIQRAVSEQAVGLRQLVVLVSDSPLRWRARREAEMLLGWLAAARRAGLETWIVYGSDRAELSVMEGVRLLGVPPLGQEGGVVVLQAGSSGIGLRVPHEPGPALRVPAAAAASAAG